MCVGDAKRDNNEPWRDGALLRLGGFHGLRRSCWLAVREPNREDMGEYKDLRLAILKVLVDATRYLVSYGLTCRH